MPHLPLLSVLVFASFVGRGPSQALVWVPCPFNCREYGISTTQASWTVSNAAAQGFGARLATIHSAAEQAWIDQVFGGPTTRPAGAGPCSRPEIFWIGLSRFDAALQCAPLPPATTLPQRQALESRFRWVDGSALNYTNWGSLEPNNFCDVASNPACAGSECAVNVAYKLPNQTIGTQGYWNDAPDRRCFYALYERDQVGYQTFGIACGASSGPLSTPPTLSASGPPRVGQSFTLTVAGLLPNSSGIFLFGGWGGAQLPLPLDVIGMTGCAANVALSGLIAQEPVRSDAGGASRLTLVLPTMTNLIGFALINQYFHVHPGANPLGLIATQGGCGVLR